MTEITPLNQLLTGAGLETLTLELSQRFSAYQRLLAKWNSKLSLTAIRSDDDILSRHFVECIFCARHLPADAATLLDFGSGAGFPGIPIALCRPEIKVTLAESHGKKSAFLREAVRVLQLEVKVYADRAQQLTETFDVVAMRAVEHMEDAIPAAVERVAWNGVLALMASTASHFPERYPQLVWSEPQALPYSDRGVLLIGRPMK